MTTQLSRRTMLTVAAGAAAAALVAPRASAATSAIAAIERKYDRVIGVYARNLATGQTLTHRAKDRFAMCSTFKVPLSAAVLAGHLVADGPHALDRRMPYPPSMVHLPETEFEEELWAPTTKKWLREGYIPTLGEMCAASIGDSDNGAANVIIQQVGGPAKVTEYFRSIGDRTSRLDRWEPEMSVYEPVTHQDSTTPYAMATTFVDLLLGDALRPKDRRTLMEWTTTTSLTSPFSTVLPEGWRLADKTGSGDYASRNDVGIVWDTKDVPYVISCFSRSDRQEEERIEAPVAEVFTACVAALS